MLRYAAMWYALSGLNGGLQQAFRNQVPPIDALSNLSTWQLDEPPSLNSTGHLVFETVSSLLQHWPNTRMRNGELFHYRL